MKITATNKATGEVIELEASTPEQIVAAWRTAQEYDKAAASLKDQLKKLVPSFVGPKGVSDPIGNYQFRVSAVQRMTYDKALMREVFDSDTFDVLLKPDKPAVDKYLKELVASDIVGAHDPAISVALRRGMVADGRPYQTIRLEKVTRDE